MKTFHPPRDIQCKIVQRRRSFEMPNQYSKKEGRRKSKSKRQSGKAWKGKGVVLTAEGITS